MGECADWAETRCGFDATCSSTQLQRVCSAAKDAARARRQGGQDFMGRVVYLPLSPEMDGDTAARLADAVLTGSGTREAGAVARSGDVRWPRVVVY